MGLGARRGVECGPWTPPPVRAVAAVADLPSRRGDPGRSHRGPGDAAGAGRSLRVTTVAQAAHVAGRRRRAVLQRPWSSQVNAGPTAAVRVVVPTARAMQALGAR